jgi:hypothetical protein
MGRFFQEDFQATDVAHGPGSVATRAVRDARGLSFSRRTIRAAMKFPASARWAGARGG